MLVETVTFYPDSRIPGKVEKKETTVIAAAVPLWSTTDLTHN